ncbi:DUF4143 domain-containing protein, partial [bacterium]|nr:DUF4143 domain-containing protein [bacterium]
KFWRMKYGVEVDFIIDEEKIMPIEVKLSETDTVPVGISSFLNNYKTENAIIANRKIVKEAGRIKFAPFYVL